MSLKLVDVWIGCKIFACFHVVQLFEHWTLYGFHNLYYELNWQAFGQAKKCGKFVIFS